MMLKGRHDGSLLDRAVFLRWVIYAGIGVIVGVLYFLTGGNDDATGSYATALSTSLGLGLFTFAAVAFLLESIFFEVSRVVLIFPFFAWLYDSIFPRPVGVIAVAVVIVLAWAIAYFAYRYRSRPFAECRRFASQIAVALLLCPVLWFCANVDPCLDRGGVWEWSDYRCRRQ